MQKLVLSITFTLFLNLFAFAQNEEEKKSECPQPEDKKVIDLYKKGTDKKKYHKPERLKFLEEALKIDPEYAEANMALGNEIIVKCKLDNLPFATARPQFLAAVRACPKIHSEPYYFIGFSFYEDAKNDSAIKYLDLFLKFTDDDEKKFGKDYQFEQYQAKEMIKAAKKETELKKKIVPFNPKVLANISTGNNEYLPYISPDESIILFTRTMPNQSKDKVYQTDKEKEVFMISHKQKDGSFDKGEPMEWPFNENSNEGGACLTVDNKHLYYTIYKMEGGTQPNADIYYSDLIDGAWSEIRKVPNINDPVYWDSQPSVSADGNSIYFASDRPGGYGKVDIWKTDRDPVTKQWKKPVNMGPKINTPGVEKCPFIHSDSETLYYSSDGLYGFGGLDIFYVRKDEKGNWKEPENIGSPINTEGDDAGFFVSADGLKGYFCSYSNEGKVRGQGVGKYDVYYFDLYKEARPEEVTFIRGQIKTPDGEIPKVNAVIEIKNVKTHEKTQAVYDSTTGHYVAAVNLKKNKEGVVVTVKAPDYSFTSQKVEVKQASFIKPPDSVKLQIEKVETGKSFVINNILYATGAAELYPESFVTLDEFAEYLKENPSFKVEIQGHTDNVGKEADNIMLSQKRADNVKKYLETKGIRANRVTAKGYGAGKPIASNATVDGKAKNRRTEFLILDK
ncbi:MAG TPA: OmpA family protein [Bacteroidia bacterium]|jgi:outer membrane protein OmpA-like peptidoglycan-associated protein|nr:OmpA family protein [Bacteroidia bacterium]